MYIFHLGTTFHFPFSSPYPSFFLDEAHRLQSHIFLSYFFLVSYDKMIHIYMFII